MYDIIHTYADDDDDARRQSSFEEVPSYSATTTPRDHKVLLFASAESTMSYYEENDELYENDITLQPSPRDSIRHSDSSQSSHSRLYGSPSVRTLEPEIVRKSSTDLTMSEDDRSSAETVQAVGRE